MKKRLFYLLFSCSIVALSCEKVDDKVQSITTIISNNGVDNKINKDDIFCYMNAIFPQTKSEDIQISPFTYDNDTILFEVKYGNSYKIFSADKRLPVIIAYSDKGSYIDMESCPAFKNWIKEEAKYLGQLRKNLPDTLTNKHTKAWDRIKSKYKVWTRAEGDPEEEEGYWRWISTDTIDVNTQVVGHLITTPWHQKSPYNSCVPYQYNSSERCAAGCVAVAGAHILHYTNQKLGLPTTMPSSGSCSGWYKSPSLHDYTISFGNRTSTAWNLIDANNYSAVATLIGWVAHNVNMQYGASSGAYPEDFQDFLDSEGIKATYVNFNGLTAFNRVLKYSEPVYISSEIVNDDGTSDHHSYILDRAKLVTYTTESLYEYVPHMNGGISTGETKYEIEELLDYFVSLRMGWELSQYIYDDIYVYIYNWDYPGFYLPEDGRKMMYNFRTK